MKKGQNSSRSGKNDRGCAATYKALINALLNFGCKNDAESLCKMFKDQQPLNPEKYLQSHGSAEKGSGSS